MIELIVEIQMVIQLNRSTILFLLMKTTISPHCKLLLNLYNWNFNTVLRTHIILPKNLKFLNNHFIDILQATSNKMYLIVHPISALFFHYQNNTNFNSRHSKRSTILQVHSKHSRSNWKRKNYLRVWWNIHLFEIF